MIKKDGNGKRNMPVQEINYHSKIHVLVDMLQTASFNVNDLLSGLQWWTKGAYESTGRAETFKNHLLFPKISSGTVLWLLNMK